MWLSVTSFLSKVHLCCNRHWYLFLFMANNIPSCGSYICAVHACIHGHLGSFHFLTLTGDVAVNFSFQVLCGGGEGLLDVPKQGQGCCLREVVTP